MVRILLMPVRALRLVAVVHRSPVIPEGQNPINAREGIETVLGSITPPSPIHRQNPINARKGIETEMLVYPVQVCDGSESY